MLRRSIPTNGRFVSSIQHGFKIYAVSGTNAVSFGLSPERGADTTNLIGFGVKRTDTKTRKTEILPSRKWFLEDYANQPTDTTARSGTDGTAGGVFDQLHNGAQSFSSFEHPLQSFTIDDVDCADGRRYKYQFVPILRDAKANSSASIHKQLKPDTRRALSITLSTEKQFDPKHEHNMIFNRAMCASQEFAERYACGEPGCEDESLASFDLKLPDDAVAAFSAKSWNLDKVAIGSQDDMLVWVNAVLAGAAGRADPTQAKHTTIKSLHEIEALPAKTRTMLRDRATTIADAKGWLARDLLDGFIKFIAEAKKGDTLYGLFYEFNHPTILEALKDAAVSNGVNVRLLLDMNLGSKSSPREATLAKLREYNFPIPLVHTLKPGAPPNSVKVPSIGKNGGSLEIIARTLRPSGSSKDDTTKVARSSARVPKSDPSHLQHNKVMILSRGGDDNPQQLWSGSANVTESAIIGQLNVATWSRNADLAAQYLNYWKELAHDPCLKTTQTFVDNNTVTPPVQLKQIPAATAKNKKNDEEGSVVPIFSPRSKPRGMDSAEKGKWWTSKKPDIVDSTLHLLFQTLVGDIHGDRASAKFAAMTLPFGVPTPLANLLTRKEGKPFEKTQYMQIMLNQSLVPLGRVVGGGDEKLAGRAKSEYDKWSGLKEIKNLSMAYGENLQGPVGDYVAETTSKQLALSSFVPFIHAKASVNDPLTLNPIVVCGSANFSSASQYSNDENSLIFSSSTRIADITEFNRVFQHYKLRNKINKLFAKTQLAVKKSAEANKVLTAMTIQAFWDLPELKRLLARDPDLRKESPWSSSNKDIVALWKEWQNVLRSRVLSSSAFWSTPKIQAELAPTREMIVKKLKKGTTSIAMVSDDSWVKEKFGVAANTKSKARLELLKSMEGAKNVRK